MTAASFDLVVRGGTVVGPGAAGYQEIADIAVKDGRITQIGGPMTGRDEIDARGLLVLLVLPGGLHRGQVVLADGLSLARPGQGQWLRRGRTQAGGRDE